RCVCRLVPPAARCSADPPLSVFGDPEFNEKGHGVKPAALGSSAPRASVRPRLPVSSCQGAWADPSEEKVREEAAAPCLLHEVLVTLLERGHGRQGSWRHLICGGDA